MLESEYVLIHDLARVRCAIEVLSGTNWNTTPYLRQAIQGLYWARDAMEKKVQAIEMEADK